jgi:2-polyprenyl-3-methyl-5-hydroxy-6-metoxy-1,4-benzoquinol methylase
LNVPRHGYDSYYYDRYYSGHQAPTAEVPLNYAKAKPSNNGKQADPQSIASSPGWASGATPFLPRLNTSHHALLGRLVSRSLPAGRALEIGCGAGQLMDSLKRDGWRVEGIEADPRNAEQARRTTGLPVWEGDFRGINLPVGVYQLIVVSRLFPHFDNPVSALFRLEELLAPGGQVLFCYPNQASLGARLFREHWLAWEPERQMALPDCPALKGSARFAGLTGDVRTDWRNAAVFSAFARAYGAGQEPDFDRPAVKLRDRSVAWLERLLVLIGFDLGEEIVAVFHKRAA